MTICGLIFVSIATILLAANWASWNIVFITILGLCTFLAGEIMLCYSAFYEDLKRERLKEEVARLRFRIDDLERKENDRQK